MSKFWKPSSQNSSSFGKVFIKPDDFSDLQPKPLEQLTADEIRKNFPPPIPPVIPQKTDPLKNKRNSPMLWNTIKDFLVQKIAGWLLKVASGFFLAHSISQNTIEELIAAIVSFAFGLIISLTQHKKAALMSPDKFLNS